MDSRLAQEESFPGRCGEGGDEVGSRINAARLVRDVMRMCFLLERRYAPYGKGLGTAFCAPESVDQFADSTNLLMRSDLRHRLRVLFKGVC